MRPSGLAEVEAAKADGRWAIACASQRNAIVPPDLAAALAASPQAARAFGALGKTQQYAVILKLVTARTASAASAAGSAVMLASAGSARPRRPNAVKTTMGRQVRVGSRVSRIGQVRAPAAMAASSPYPPPQVCSLPAARTTSRALAAPASDEVDRLRAVLRRQAIEPGDGTA
jgi:Bacteriocin-protection, YdeI or OmpD-Associated